MRNIHTFNNEYLYQCWLEETQTGSKPDKYALIKNILFYGLMLLLVLFAMFANLSGSNGRKLGPLAYNTVLTSSMKDVYPPGSLILSWELGVDETVATGLENGTDIVFVRENGTVVVHRVIEVTENYEDSGQRGFNTQGVNNAAPDSWVTYEGNVIGKVVFSVPYLGAILSFIGENVVLVGVAMLLLMLVISLWKTALSKE